MKMGNFFKGGKHLASCRNVHMRYEARARNARARRACALRALGLSLADGALTVQWDGGRLCDAITVFL